MVGNVLALRMRGTIIFQLAPRELVALRMRGTKVPLPSSRCLVNWHFVMERCILSLALCYGKVNIEKGFKIEDFLYVLTTGPFIYRRNAIDVKGLNPFF
ncbi:hypothetical protein CsSME_00027936 [Camellia sinensis var. sinensis]